VGSAERDLPLLGSQAVILEGGSEIGRLRGLGYSCEDFAPIPAPGRAEVLLPARDPRCARYAFRRSPPSARWKRSRNELLIRMLARGMRPPGVTLITTAQRSPGQPFLVRAASEMLAEVDGWLLTPAQGDALSRGTLHIFSAGAAEPTWVIKFARVPGYSKSFDRDEKGLAVVQAAGERVARRAPALLGRFQYRGLHASVETAAVGRPLASFLTSNAPRAEKLELVDEIAGWIADLGSATAQPAGALNEERARLREVVAAYAELGASPALVDDLPELPAVSQHNDLGTWNIIVDRSRAEWRFTVVDWESARRHGMPLWDLWYFLQHALAEIDGVTGLGPTDLQAREEHAARLFRGELPASAIVVRWTRAVQRALQIPSEALGRLATLCFLHHGLSQSERERNVSEFGAGSAALEMLGPRLARRWLADRRLGPDWQPCARS